VIQKYVHCSIKNKINKEFFTAFCSIEGDIHNSLVQSIIIKRFERLGKRDDISKTPEETLIQTDDDFLPQTYGDSSKPKEEKWDLINFLLDASITDTYKDAENKNAYY